MVIAAQVVAIVLGLGGLGVSVVTLRDRVNFISCHTLRLVIIEAYGPNHRAAANSILVKSNLTCGEPPLK